MARQERFANDAATTLNGAINASVTSLTVTSATVFPTEGDFRLKIGASAEIILVTAVAGAVFTIVRGVESTTPTTHADSATVTAMATKGALEQHIRDNDPWAGSRPPFRIVDTNGAVLTASDFTEVNFTDAAASSDTNANITITKDDHTANSISALVRSAPSTPYTITAAVSATLYADALLSGPKFGILFREAATGELVCLDLYPGKDDERAYNANAYDSPTDATPTNVGETRPNLLSMPIWIRIEDDGVDLKFYASSDGVFYQFIVEVARGDHFTTTPDQIGFFLNNEDGRDGAHASLLAWDGE